MDVGHAGDRVEPLREVEADVDGDRQRVGHEHHLVADELHGAPAVRRHDVEGRVLERVDELRQPFDGHTLAELGEAAQVGEAHGLLDRVRVGLEPAAERGHEVPAPHVHQRILEELEHRLVDRRDQHSEEVLVCAVGSAPGSASASCSTTASCASAMRENDTPRSRASRRMASSSTSPAPASAASRFTISTSSLGERGDVLGNFGEPHRTPPLHRPLVIDPGQAGNVVAPVFGRAEPDRPVQGQGCVVHVAGERRAFIPCASSTTHC